MLSAIYQDINRTQENLRTATTTVSGRWNQQISDQLRVSLLLQWQDVDDSSGLDSQAFEQGFELNWRYRQTEIYGRVRNSFRDSTTDDTAFQTFVVGLRRKF